METQTFSHGDLDGHIFPLPLLYDGSKLLLLEREIPEMFLDNEETFRNHITMVLPKTCLSSSIQERLVTHISKLEAVKVRSHRRGFKIEIEINVNMYHTVDIGSGCKGKKACPLRVVGDRHVAKRVTGADCPICLTELSSEMSRMELPCSHVFHSECVVKWLNNSTSCPICRAQDFGEVSIY
ncbi:E3 ubiquitin-protein ligase BIG BROTHER [Cardamine amara subsp. amara]|uniref:RING-type E3 ubiquitin transferase n=1 Tax=Cardamine amara subsp. amara TaxID=228776 RepID=A0ABD1AI68_CARAN